LNKKYRILSISFIVWLVVLTCGWNVYNVNRCMLVTKHGYETWEKYCPGVLQFIQSNTADAEYMFATKETYRLVFLGNLLRFNLVAYRDGNYYSLNPDLSEKMLNHYNAILSSNDFGLMKEILNHYGIRYILIHKGEESLYAGLRRLLENCRPAYQDDVFTVLELK